MAHFTRVVTAVSYSLEIVLDDFLALNTYEYVMIGDISSVSELLEKNTAAYNVDYNNHFGNHIFMTLKPSDDLPAEWATIESIITQGIEDAKDWMENNTVTRIVCARLGEMHYSATADIAMDRCPVCDAPTTSMILEID